MSWSPQMPAIELDRLILDIDRAEIEIKRAAVLIGSQNNSLEACHSTSQWLNRALTLSIIIDLGLVCFVLWQRCYAVSRPAQLLLKRAQTVADTGSTTSSEEELPVGASPTLPRANISEKKGGLTAPTGLPLRPSDLGKGKFGFRASSLY
jgi:hypothetical protein